MNKFDMTPSNFLHRQRCPKCREKEKRQREANLIKLNGQKFCEEVFNETNGEYEVVGEYIATNKKVDILHKKCNKIFSMTPTHFKRGQRCTNKECIKMRHSDGCANGKGTSFYERFETFSNEYEVLDEYHRWNSEITFKHKMCNCIFKMTPNSFFNTTNNVYGIKCPDCLKKEIYKNSAKTKEQFQNEINDISNNEYIVLGEYINRATPILMHHIKCKNTWMARPGNLLNGTGCPYCASDSKLEVFVKNILEENKIKFIPQYKFSGLKGVGNKLLSYDFYLLDYNLLIECQGKQHEQPVDHFGGEDQFKIQQEHDRRKREYAKAHKIQLLEIWYWDINNIEKILKKTLNKLEKTA